MTHLEFVSLLLQSNENTQSTPTVQYRETAVLHQFKSVGFFWRRYIWKYVRNVSSVDFGQILPKGPDETVSSI